MPNFPKNTDYKMKGSTFYGHGNSSPAKVSDDKVVAAQKNLDEIQLKFNEPGWAKAARGIHEGAKGVVSKFMNQDPEEDGNETENQMDSVADIAANNMDIEGELE